MASSESCLLPGLGHHEGCGQSIPATPVGSLEPSSQGWQEPGPENWPSLASTSISSVSWLSGCIQKTHQGPLPVQKLLVATHLCNGSIFQHHDPISLGQNMERMGHENPCLGREGLSHTHVYDQSSRARGWGGECQAVSWGSGWREPPFLYSHPLSPHPSREIEGLLQTVSWNKKTHRLHLNLDLVSDLRQRSLIPDPKARTTAVVSHCDWGLLVTQHQQSKS